MKATEKIQQLLEDINNEGLSGVNGVYAHVHFKIDHGDVDVEPKGIVRMNLKDAMTVSNQMRNAPRVVVLDGEDPVICRCLHKRGGHLDIHVTCSSTEFPNDIETVMASAKVQLEKFAKDCGFTPGEHHYNILDAYVPWESARVVYLEKDQEGWI